MVKKSEGLKRVGEKAKLLVNGGELWLRYGFDPEQKQKIEGLYEHIKPYRFISLDIFDTLLKRNVDNPTDIFSIVETLGKKTENKNFFENYRQRRIEAEKAARKELIDSEHQEVNIEDIYRFYFDDKTGKSQNAKDKCELIKQLELDTEYNSIVPNLPILWLYNKCLEDKKTVFITSDIYWPEEDIRRILEKCGIRGFSNLYVSSVYKKTKNSGDLFRILLNDQGIDSKQLIHIGDNLKSDFLTPRRLGIGACLIPTRITNVEYRGIEYKSLPQNYINCFINNSIRLQRNTYYDFGYTQFGKLLWGFSRWLYTNVKSKSIADIYFFSRDGYIMKQAFDLLISDKSIHTHYLEVSRRSLRVPILWQDCNINTVIEMVVNAKLVTLRSIFDGIGLEIDNHAEAIKESGLELDSVFDRSTIKEDERLQKLIGSLKSDIIKNSKEEFDALSLYLKEKKVSGHIAVVDIGYAGSMQRYLEQALNALGIENDLEGFYICVNQNYKKNELKGLKLNLNGYIFDFSHNKDAEDTRSSFVGLFESLFLEQGGSVKRYVRKTSEQIIVERYPYEYYKKGRPTQDYQIIKEIQSGALDFVRNVAKDKVIMNFNYEAKDLFRGLYLTGAEPDQRDLDAFSDLNFYDEGEEEKLAHPQKMTFYLRYPNELKKDFLKCRWKTAFLKKLFKIPLNYQRIYRMLLKYK